MQVELKYPRGWSFAQNDSFESVKVKGSTSTTADQKYKAIQKQLKYKLDRDIYIQARTYSEGPVNGGIDRFIEGMRKGFTIDQILDGKYDGIIDTDPRNRIIPTTPMPSEEPTNDDIESIQNAGYASIEDMAKDLWKSPSTVKRWRRDGLVAKVWERYFLNEQDSDTQDEPE